jgi:hypothetical protein
MESAWNRLSRITRPVWIAALAGAAFTIVGVGGLFTGMTPEYG